MLTEEDRSRLVDAFVTALRETRADRPDDGSADDQLRRSGQRLIEQLWRGDTNGRDGNPFAHLVRTIGPADDPARAALVLTAMRAVLVTTFAYAVPSDEALAAIVAAARAGEIVEIGAGGGYWARCLADRGARVRAFDVKRPGDQNRRGRSLREHHPVEVGGPREALAAAPGAETLLLCWPPGLTNRAEVDAGLAPPRYASLGMDALARFRGSNLVFVGAETRSFGSPAFFACLARDFALVATFPLVNLARWRDAAHVYRRRAQDGIPLIAGS